MNSTSELGTGKIGKLLFSLAIPAIAAQLINALYNIVDRMYIGHIPGVGATALTGVGVTFPIIMVIAAFAALIGMGGAPRAAIKMGEDDYDGAEKILGNCFISLI
ncbi:MAG: MATE family efflux transporter, partial [Oscillospiraceae bacterium]